MKRVRGFTRWQRMGAVLPGLALMTGGCTSPCGAVITEAGDSAHSARLVWHNNADAVSLTYASVGDPKPRSAVVDSDGVTHTATLWGLPPYSALVYQLTNLATGESCEDVHVTGGVEPDLPALDVTLNYPDQTASWAYLAGVAMGKTGTVFIIDRRGQLRWHEVHDPEIGVSTVLMDNGSLYHNIFDADRVDDIGAVASWSIPDGDRLEVRTTGSHHTFVRLPDGTTTVLAVDVRSVVDPSTGDEIDLIGDRVVEFGPDGEEREVWSVWDDEEPDIAETQVSSFYGTLGRDWTHANGLHYSAHRDSYLVSLGHLDIIYELDRVTGVPLRRLSAADVVEGQAFHFQHDPSWTAAGTLLMMSYPEDGAAVAVEYSVSADNTLSEVWSYRRDNSGITLLGQARRLENGNTFINFGGIGEMREVTPEGAVVWQLHAGIGSFFGNGDILTALP